MSTVQFIIPIYQRNYSWTEREGRWLWDDIIRTGSDDNIEMLTFYLLKQLFRFSRS